jgi:hypothetical protein
MLTDWQFDEPSQQHSRRPPRAASKLASDRYKLRFAQYETPAFRYGARVWDEFRGWVKIVGLSRHQHHGQWA